MPVGHRDQRRQGHRCSKCREHHRKCDTRRPCKPCTSHGLQCEEPVRSQSDVTMIEYQPPISKHPAFRLLWNDAWLYARIFFDAVNASDSLLISAFSFDEIGSLVQENGLVFDAVAIVGATYAHRISTDIHLSPSQVRDLNKLCHGFRQQVAATLDQKRALQDSNSLLCAQLLAVVELMTDNSGDRWDFLQDRIQCCLSTQNYVSQISAGFHQSLVIVTRINIALRNLLASDELRCTNLLETSCIYPSVYGPQLKFSDPQVEGVECLVRALEYWAHLRYRSVRWIRTVQGSLARLRRGPVSGHPARESTEGLEIVCLACELQKEIVSTLLAQPTTSNSEGGRDFMVPFYHWILTGLSHMFSRPEWKFFDWKTPVMHAKLLEEQALKALHGAERLVRKARLDAILYAAMSPVVAVEISSPEDRDRVIKLLQDIRGKGFAAASSFESDLLVEWKYNPSS